MPHISAKPGLVRGTGLAGMGQQQPRYTKAPTFVRPEEPEGWRAYAACASEDPELFFPVGETGPAILQIEDAKSVCFRCPAMASCYDWAMQAEPEGVWGGTTAKERGQIKRRAARQRTTKKAA